jgi:hypothetical protein
VFLGPCCTDHGSPRSRLDRGEKIIYRIPIISAFYPGLIAYTVQSERKTKVSARDFIAGREKKSWFRIPILSVFYPGLRVYSVRKVNLKRKWVPMSRLCPGESALKILTRVYPDCTLIFAAYKIRISRIQCPSSERKWSLGESEIYTGLPSSVCGVY